MGQANPNTLGRLVVYLAVSLQLPNEDYSVTTSSMIWNISQQNTHRHESKDEKVILVIDRLYVSS
jgi:hypothetical protein